MASATRKAQAAARAALQTLEGTSDISLAEELFSAGRAIGSSLQLRTLLAEPAGDAEVKAAAVRAVFGSSLSANALSLLVSIVSERWSRADDLLASIEDVAIRCAADSTDADVASELFAIEQMVTSSPELELSLGSKLASASGKAELVSALLGERVSAATLAIVRHLVQQPRGRRLSRLVTDAARIVAEQENSVLATVSTASPLDDSSRDRLRSALSGRYGNVRFNELVDPSLVGGVRIVIGDEVIDGSVAARLAELRQQLAG
ncbi:F0F1 ATP synthase subunit delta [Salinibacterium sp. dk2585]|uniref:F0F1 ATP synthase subunit delta n=1 Tax=unclassified Salinibacterium TaxID=2632331 RepID=UPI0011C252B0|nr:MULTISPECIES: F0F1 ATP synthase subunit delta [unclassified Salinibacterium]QEE61751.1 F0F1 ATP synthase subunit delta [Salinibacterium sp. dk2585]TXK54694.1 F0F1 ATP synthase subunit delta [Salinibacterium sp. dk5596]